MTVDIYAPSAQDGLEPEEQKLYNLVNEYRAENGLPPVLASKALTLVANRHVLDLAENLDYVNQPDRDAISTHTWSDAPFDRDNPATHPSMWNAPQRFETGYPGNGYEMTFNISEGFATAEDALAEWRSPLSDASILLNQGTSANKQWHGLGVAIHENYAVLWFGEELDPAGTPAGFAAPPGEFFNLSAFEDTVNLGLFPDTAGRSVRALDGNDVIQGSDRDDDINGNRGTDEIRGASGSDTLRGGKESDTIFGDEGNDILNGNNNADLVFGGAGDDIVRGGKDSDTLLGEAGNDFLVGDLGQDSLIGGAGSDVFVLRADNNGESRNTSPNANEVDIISDFNLAEGDKIALNEGLSFSSLIFEEVQATIGAETSPAVALRLGDRGDYLGIILNADIANIQDAANFIPADDRLALG